MSTYNDLQNEIVYFDATIKKDPLLLTSEIISYKGSRLLTKEVTYLTKISRRQTVNGIPNDATFNIHVGNNVTSIVINCARWGGRFWRGLDQFEQLSSAMFQAVGKRLIDEALAALYVGETLKWTNKISGFEKDSTIYLSKDGIRIRQIGVLFNKELTVKWDKLNFSYANGGAIFKDYETGRTATVRVWDMPNNIVLNGVLGFLTQRAKYRIFES